jgi:hypothetical protein
MLVFEVMEGLCRFPRDEQPAIPPPVLPSKRRDQFPRRTLASWHHRQSALILFSDQGNAIQVKQDLTADPFQEMQEQLELRGFHLPYRVVIKTIIPV